MQSETLAGLPLAALQLAARRTRPVHCALLVGLFGVLGCSTDVSRPTPPESRLPKFTPVQNLQMLPSREELALVEQIQRIYPGIYGDSLAAYLTNSTVVGVKSSNPRVQAILDRLDAVRRPRLDSAWRANVSNQPRSAHVTIALVDSIGDSTVTAVVLRRLSRQPRELILLTPATASPGALGAALHALVRQRALDGDSARRDVKIVVRGAHVPASWTAARLAMTRVLLQELRQRPISPIVGVGRARSQEIGLSAQ